ncbi:hypothetical protein PMIN06_008122 [Paraphaeosphaeria minitans]|uniref:Uncharacterized protein n=1 Tax=Paraphaeosphaeria minitans TaxID=565426 RepID=A0A9P6KW37_9PLEO|nr:hypothetical protein PMIN01_00606 [Paraphaeosphaeria minitans]
MRIFAILSSLALASAVAVPMAKANTPGHLTYGDVQLELNTNGCQAVPQNKDDGLPKPSALFTKLQVNSGYICQLYRQTNCIDSFWKMNGPGQQAEYVDGWLFSAKCTTVATKKVKAHV